MLMVWFMEKECCDQTTPISLWSLASRVFIRSNLGWERPRWWDSLGPSWPSPSCPAAPGWRAPGATPRWAPDPPGAPASRPRSGSSCWNTRCERWEREREREREIIEWIPNEWESTKNRCKWVPINTTRLLWTLESWLLPALWHHKSLSLNKHKSQ